MRLRQAWQQTAVIGYETFEQLTDHLFDTRSSVCLVLVALKVLNHNVIRQTVKVRRQLQRSTLLVLKFTWTIVNFWMRRSRRLRAYYFSLVCP
jgi:hypothetical protein